MKARRVVRRAWTVLKVKSSNEKKMKMKRKDAEKKYKQV